VYRRIILLLALCLVAILEIGQLFDSNSFKEIELPRDATHAAVVVENEVATVAHVLDGDTVELTDGRRVRYIGIDAPEIAHEHKKAECFGREALEANKRLVWGKRVGLEKDISDVDTYGRLLRYVYVDNFLVNDRLVEEGFARAWNVLPDERHKAIFFQSHIEAQAKNRGMWELCGK
jgi:micrococcal nuclease